MTTPAVADGPPGGGAGGVVVITGGSGRLGAAAALRLGAAYHVVAFDRAGPPHPPPGVETVEVDLTSEADVRAALTRVKERHGPKVASVLHFAAFYEFADRPDPRYHAVNIEGSARLLRGLQAVGLNVGQFVYASTMIVHAPGAPGVRINEDSPLGPPWRYARSKLDAENALRDGRGAVPLVVLRLASVYDGLCHHPVLAQQVRRVFERRLVSRLFPGDPSSVQSVVHQDDLLDALERVIARRRDLPAETTLLIGEPDPMSYAETQRALGRLLHGEDWPTRRVPKPLAKLGARVLGLLPVGGDPFLRPWIIDLADAHYDLDTSRARALLGWEPRRSLRATLPEIAVALRADPARFYRENGLSRG